MNSLGERQSGLAGAMFDPYAGVAKEVRSTPLGRLENAMNRLDAVASSAIAIAGRMVGPWPTEGLKSASTAPAGGVFGEMEAMADAIHRIADRLDEANRAVQERLP